jgi:hypothetical protein
MALSARLATEANGGVLDKYVEAGRPSVTPQTRSYPPPQYMVGGSCRLKSLHPNLIICVDAERRRYLQRLEHDLPGTER